MVQSFVASVLMLVWVSEFFHIKNITVSFPSTSFYQVVPILEVFARMPTIPEGSEYTPDTSNVPVRGLTAASNVVLKIKPSSGSPPANSKQKYMNILTQGQPITKLALSLNDPNKPKENSPWKCSKDFLKAYVECVLLII